MTDWHDQQAAAELRRVMRAAIPVEDPEYVSARRGQLVAHIEQEISRVPLRAASSERKKRAMRWALSAAAVALFGLTGGAYLSDWDAAPRANGAHGSPAGVERRAMSTPHAATAKQARLALVEQSKSSKHGSPAADTSDALQVGSLLTLQDNQTARLALPGGTKMVLSLEGSMRLLEAEELSQHVRLGSGRLDVDVPEGVSPRRRVRVTTPHALVEVKGTLFTVQVSEDAAGQASTSVAVERGEVWVHREDETVRLHPGQSWNSAQHVQLSVTSGSEGPEGSVASNERAFQDQKKELRPVPKFIASAEKAPRQGAQPSTLAYQNSMLERAVWLEQQGRTDQAEAVLGRLMTKYPQSPLRSTVQAELKRLRAKTP